MNIIMFLWMFIIGTIFGSFYNVVGFRLPLNKSVVSPPSHCPKCNHQLSVGELIPIVSYVIQGGKCRSCGLKISAFYPFFEGACGLLFALAYLSFGFSKELIIALTFISMLIIIVVSDINYLIIPDSILLIFGIALATEIYFIYGLDFLIKSLANGILAFILMLGLKTFGNFLFKRESMGGGDIKLMFIVGMVLTFPMSILTIFLASLIGFPIALIIIKRNSDHVIPFGPLLALGAVIILLLQINFDSILTLYGLS